MTQAFDECVSRAVGWLEREYQRHRHPALETALGRAREGLASGRLPSFLVGSFEDDQIAQTIEHVASLGRTGCLSVFADADWTVLWFETGRVVHSESPAAVGRDAVRTALELPRGWYLLLPGTLPREVPRSLPHFSSVTGLLLDILRELDEQRAGHRAAPAPSPAVAGDLALALPAEAVLEVRMLTRDLRDAHMERSRAELDAWYYREDQGRVDRRREAEQRCHARLFQWLAARSAFDVVDALQAAGTVSAQVETMDVLISRAGERTVFGPCSGAFRTGDEEAAWSVLEEAD